MRCHHLQHIKKSKIYSIDQLLRSSGSYRRSPTNCRCHQHCWYRYDKQILFLTSKYLGILNLNSLAPQWYAKLLPRAIYTHLKPLYICCLCLHWALSNSLWSLWDFLHIFKIKITYTPCTQPLICWLLHWKLRKNMPSIYKNAPFLFWQNSLYSSCRKIWAM